MRRPRILFNRREWFAHIADEPVSVDAARWEHADMPPDSNLLRPLRAGPTSTTALLKTLQLPRPTVARALQNLQREGEVLKLGATRGTRYALPRSVRDAGSSWPVYRVDAAGRVHELGQLKALMPRHFHFESGCAALRGLTEGLPWFIHTLCPAGFLAGVPAAHAGATAADPADEHHIAWFARHGWDCPGDLVVGAEALDVLRRAPPRGQAIPTSERATQYPRLADAALADSMLAGGRPGTQLPGEQPKFTVLADHGGHLVHALVKFSPPMTTPAGQRWADLLMAEHLAHGYLNARGVGAVHSRLFRFGGRMFLEVDRFDRTGVHGRRGVVSLQALAMHDAGAPYGWSQAAGRLAAAGMLPRNDARQVRLIEAFAGLIANTDRGGDNLTLFDHHDGSFALAPVYDMLPMHFAPRSEQLPTDDFNPPVPDGAVVDVWPHARRLAEGYWERLAGEPQLSADFRALCAAALAAVRGMPSSPTDPPRLLITVASENQSAPAVQDS